jgi:hypothetical protein
MPEKIVCQLLSKISNMIKLFKLMRNNYLRDLDWSLIGYGCAGYPTGCGAFSVRGESD